jgi:hypothetical protein
MDYNFIAARMLKKIHKVFPFRVRTFTPYSLLKAGHYEDFNWK